MTYTQHRANLKNVCSILATADSAEITQNQSTNKKLELFYSNGDDSVLFRTFEEWQNLGYKVLRLETLKTPKKFKILGVTAQLFLNFLKPKLLIFTIYAN
jgi:hypothetical protein